MATAKFAKEYLSDKNISLRTLRLINDDDDKGNRQVRQWSFYKYSFIRASLLFVN